MTLSVRVLVGVLLVALGVVWLLQSTGIVHFDPNLIAPAVLVVIGIALAVGAPRGLHVPLFVAGIVLTIVLAGNDVTVGNARLERQPEANQFEVPMSASDLHPYRLGAGNLHIDLTHLPLDADATYRVEARVGSGRIDVDVPSGAAVTVNARSGAGNVNAFGRRSSGISSNTTTTIDYEHRARFIIELRAAVGSIVVRHRPPAPEGTH